MSFLIGLLTVVLVLDCVLLILLVLIQLPKKEAGAGVAFGDAALVDFQGRDVVAAFLRSIAVAAAQAVPFKLRRLIFDRQFANHVGQVAGYRLLHGATAVKPLSASSRQREQKNQAEPGNVFFHQPILRESPTQKLRGAPGL